MASPIVTLLIVEAHDAVRQALYDLMQSSFRRIHLHKARTVVEALMIIESIKVDIVLMDLKLPGINGVDGTRLVLQRFPHTSVVIVSNYDDSFHQATAIRSGAKAFISKRSIGKQLVPVLQELSGHHLTPLG